MHVHAFRHLAAKLFLERNPHRYDLLALLLGHRSIETTRKYYCALEMQAVSRQYSSEIIGRGLTAERRDVTTSAHSVSRSEQAPVFLASPIRAASFGKAPIQIHDLHRRRIAP
jgi:hypothetical protein